jgi:hypothetical protein
MTKTWLGAAVGGVVDPAPVPRIPRPDATVDGVDWLGGDEMLLAA